MDHHEEKQSDEVTEVDEQGKRWDHDVEEQGRKFWLDDDEPAADSEDSDDDNEVEEQKRVSDATLKRSIAPIAGACAALH